MINLVNPKATLFFVTVMPQFVPEGQPTYAQGLIMAAISVSIATAVHLALVLGAEQIRPVLATEAKTQILRAVLSLGMLAIAAWFLAKAFL